MAHSFEPNTALKYGIEEAIILKYIGYNITKNKRAQVNFEDNKYWLYTTTSKLHERFVYMTEKQLTYAIKKLKENNLIISKVDRKRNLSWYSLTEKGFEEYNQQPNDKIVNSIAIPNDKIVEPNDKIVNRSLNNISNNIYNNINKIREEVKENTAPPTLEEIESFIKERKSIISAQGFYDYYKAGNWKDKYGNLIVENWKQKILMWEKYECLQPNQQVNKKNFSERKYSAEELNSLFQSIDDIEIESPKTIEKQNFNYYDKER